MANPQEIPVWLPDPQSFAQQQERYRHDGALSYFGEYSMFVLMWQLSDFEEGLVDRCGECYVSYGKMAEVYGQGAREKCDSCFGSTFEGGYKAKIVRLTLWDMTEEVEKEAIRGEAQTKTASVQTTSDFRLRVGDFVFRGDGTRWQMQTISTNHLRSGFLMPDTADTPVGYNFGNVVQEDESSVAYTIPPESTTFLDPNDPHYPPDFGDYEELATGATLL